MKFISITIKVLSIIFISFIICQPAFSRQPDNDDPLNAPIDGGVSLLIAAGVAYGAKKAHERRKKQKDTEK